MCKGTYFLVLGHSFIIGRVVKRFKADIERCSFFGTKDPCLSTDYVDNIKILIVLLREGNVNSSR